MWARHCSASWNGSGRSGSRSMPMDDHFLHRLRREPPANFATRLKWQLDRPVPRRHVRPRLILLLALCGTAFALVAPPGRRVLGDWFTTAPNPPQTASPESSTAVPPAAVAGAARVPGATGVGGPRYAAAASAVPTPQSAPLPATDGLQADLLDAQAPARSTFAPVPIVAGALLQPPELPALSAVT